MKIGILGASDIAFRRFLPALEKCSYFSYAGVASRMPEKVNPFLERFGGKIYYGYEALLADCGIEAVYVPLPPALHFEWGKRVLESGKHLLMEKPFAVSSAETEILLSLAEKTGLAIHENYMFLYHSQLQRMKSLIAGGTVGHLRLIRAAFGFPERGGDDFRYQKSLGGGALLDCGGYPVRLAWELLGENSHVTQAKLNQPEGYEVDLYGSAVLENQDGLCAQISFGMDNAYQCQLEIWGSKATLIAPRIFTAGAEFCPDLILRSSSDEQRLKLPADDSFLHSIEVFAGLIEDKRSREKELCRILKQMRLLDAVRREQS